VPGRFLVLAVQLEPDERRILRLELGTRFRVLMARSGAEALRFAETRHPDVVILKNVMPTLSGLQVMLRLRQLVDTPIVLVTSRAAANEPSGLHIDNYVAKPFGPEKLSSRILAIFADSADGRTRTRVG
jgi:DNA-binding response OmpR family regulator